MTILKLFTVKTPYLVKEGYQTIKRRVANSDLFFEVTLSGQKVTINKTNVEEFGEEPKKTVVNDKEVKVMKKIKKLSKEKAE
ncbi:MAG: hypothetical protein Q7J11_01055 [Candidatus Roizmanbacteria bacterium]|nr:hypothetical protein [Candidatus Roizmanbacteria bacterium]